MVSGFNRVTHHKHLYLGNGWLGLDQERTPKRHVLEETKLRISSLLSILGNIIGRTYMIT